MATSVLPSASARLAWSRRSSMRMTAWASLMSAISSGVDIMAATVSRSVRVVWSCSIFCPPVRSFVLSGALGLWQVVGVVAFVVAVFGIGRATESCRAGEGRPLASLGRAHGVGCLTREPCGAPRRVADAKHLPHEGCLRAFARGRRRAGMGLAEQLPHQGRRVAHAEPRGHGGRNQVGGRAVAVRGARESPARLVRPVDELLWVGEVPPVGHAVHDV